MSRCDSHYLVRDPADDATWLVRCEDEPGHKSPHTHTASPTTSWAWFDVDEAVDEYGQPIRGSRYDDDVAADQEAYAQMFPPVGAHVTLTTTDVRQRTVAFAGALLVDGNVTAIRVAAVYEGEPCYLLVPWSQVQSVRWPQDAKPAKENS